ncbi:NUDIX hydrolase [Paractinoplanes hotanensis]|uniref:NUDIX hydrolase n=1 Tax=Paractinoplanes hotanensis TaxID=2906497 RepID=A0ABT0XXH8_9ACTN|nr:NUDIX hydrolase [Actinoplanes hotanensis]MCM4077824.1 NUDIX hydrolase [Actinoplanes hotanensis]
MPPLRVRRSVRALIPDTADRILLGRHVISESEPIAVWAAPGGGVEHGETPLAALRRTCSKRPASRSPMTRRTSGTSRTRVSRRSRRRRVCRFGSCPN